MKAIRVVLPLALLAASACVENDQSMVISNFIVAAADCTADSGGLVQTRGILDVGVVKAFQGASGGYYLWPQVVNGLASTGRESDFINITGVDVTLTVPEDLVDTGLSPQQRDAYLNYFVPAAGGRIGPADSVVFPVDVIPIAHILNWFSKVPAGTNALPRPVTVAVRPKGARGGDVLRGAPTLYPLDVCNGCLTNTKLDCSLVKSDAVLEGGCRPQQDDSTTCCTDAMSQQILCGANIPTTTTTASTP